MLLVERFAAGRSISCCDGTGPARGRDLARDAAGTVAQAADCWPRCGGDRGAEPGVRAHFHADETTWRVFCPGEGKARRSGGFGSSSARTRFARRWTRPGQGPSWPARGIDEKTGQLLPAADGGPRRLVISSDFYAVYQSAAGRPMAWSISTAQPISAGTWSGPGREPGPAEALDAELAGPVPGPVQAHDKLMAACRRPRHPRRGRRRPPRNAWRTRTGTGTPRSA